MPFKVNKYNMVESCLQKQLATRDEPLFSVGSMNHCGDDYKLNKILEVRTMFRSNPKKKNEMNGSVRSEYLRREKQLGILIRYVCYEEGNRSATSRKLTMEFSGYDWFQPPRPPEQLVVVLGIVSEEATTYSFRPELISDVNQVPPTKDYNTVSRIKNMDAAFALVHLRTSGISSGGGVLISIDVRIVEAFKLVEVLAFRAQFFKHHVVIFTGGMFHFPRLPEMLSDLVSLWFWHSMLLCWHDGLSRNIRQEKWLGTLTQAENKYHEVIESYKSSFKGVVFRKVRQFEIAIIMKLTRGIDKLKIQEDNCCSYNLRTSWIFKKGVLIRTGLMKMGQQLGFVYFISVFTI